MPDTEARLRLVDEALKLLTDSDRRNMMKEEISKLAMRQSDERIADEVLKLIER